MEHFWHNYENNDKLHLDFVLWIDSYLFDGKSELKASTDGTVTLGEVKVAQMSQLSFAAKNEVYLRLNKEVKDLNAKIVKYRQRVEKYPDDQDFQEELQQEIENYVELTKEFDGYQQTLLDTAKQIAEIRQKQAGEMLQKAIEAFDSGDTRQANDILRGIATEAEKKRHIEDYEQKKQQSDKAQELTDNAQIVVHQDIDAFQLQAKSELADVDTPIEERITKVTEIYRKADDWAQRSDYNDSNYIKLLFDYEKFLYNFSRFNEAEQLNIRLISRMEILYGSEHEDLATAYSHLGSVYSKLGDTNKALVFYNKALTIYQNKYGEDHPDTAAVYNSIGMVFFKKVKSEKVQKNSKKDYSKAIEYLMKAKTILEHEFGEDHAITANTYHCLTLVYSAMRKNDEYKYYLIKTLDILQGKEYQDEDNLENASYYDIKGYYYKSNKEYDEALFFFNKALIIRKKNLGENHISTANSYERIGMLCEVHGKLDEALNAFCNVLSIREKILVENHPKMIELYLKIASLLKKLKRIYEAIEYYIKILSIYKKYYGEKHEETVKMLGEIGKLYFKLSDFNNVIKYYFELLSIQIELYGENHPKVAELYYALGKTYKEMKDYSNALEYYKKSMNINDYFLSTTNLGSNQIKPMLFTLERIGEIYVNLGDYDHAIDYYSKARDLCEKYLGESAITDMTNKILGGVYELQGNFSMGLECYTKLYSRNMKKNGPDNQFTVEAKELIESIKKRIGITD